MLPTPAEVWSPLVADTTTPELLRDVIWVVETLLLPEYAAEQPSDRRPARAIEAAKKWMTLRMIARAMARGGRDAMGRARADVIAALR